MTKNLLNTQKVATGVSYGATASEEHASAAVKSALKKMAPCTVGSVLLFLTCGYSYDPNSAIKAAAKAAGTPQIFGCCAKSLLTEQEWLLDAEGAVAMVFPNDVSLQPLSVLEQQGADPKVVLTLTTPNAATIAVNTTSRPQIGAVATDEYGHGPFSVWQSGRIIENEFSQSAFPNNLDTHVVISEGVTPLSPVMRVNRSLGHSLYEVDLKPASENLLTHIPDSADPTPFGLLCAVSETTDFESIERGHYRLHHVVSVDRDKQLVKLSGSVKAGHHLFWATRDADAAAQSMTKKLTMVKKSLDNPPKFALMFPNIGRGPEFFDGVDQDLLAFQNTFPGTPLLGFYGNGEIAPGFKLGGLIRYYSSILAIFD